MEKKKYEAPHLEVVKVESVLPIASTIVQDENGNGSVDLSGLDEEKGQDELRSGEYFNVWDDEE